MTGSLWYIDYPFIFANANGAKYRVHFDSIDSGKYVKILYEIPVFGCGWNQIQPYLLQMQNEKELG